MESKLYSNAEVLFKPFNKQLEFLKAVFGDKYDIILYGGAIRGGKTFAGLGALLLLCKKYPKSKWAIVRTDLQTLKRNTIPSFNKICPQSFIKGYNQDTQTVTFTNDSQIIFFAENYDKDKELNRWKGLEVNGFLLEEINELQEQSFNKAIERSGSNILNPTPPKKILATCNPAQNWVKDKFYTPYKEGRLKKKWLYIPANIHDNPYIPKDYIEGLKELPSYEYEVFVNGDWEIQPRTGYEFYKDFSTDKHIKKLKYNPKDSIHISLDFNVVPYMSATIWQIQRTNRGWILNCIKEYTTTPPKNSTKGLISEFKRDYSNHRSGLYYYGDPSGKSRDTRSQQGTNDFTILHNELKDFYPKDRVLRSHPSVTGRGNFINAIFRGEIEDCEVNIDQDCKEFIKDILNLKEDADGKKLKERETKEGINYEKYGHLSDSFDYFICKLLEPQYRAFIGKKRMLLS